MAISKDTLNFLITALADAKAGKELALAIQNGSVLSAYTMQRLVIAMGDAQVAKDIQAAILGTRPLSARDLTYMNSGIASSKATANVASNVAAGVAPGAGKIISIPVTPLPVALPSFSVPAGTYGPTQLVTISSATAGATFYYTLNGSAPTTSSSLYSGPVSVASSATLKVLAVKVGLSNSAIASAAYVIDGAVATPTFSPVAGSYAGTQSVTISSATAGAAFRYTVDGSTPTIASTLYSGPVSVAASQTLKVLAVKAGFSNSAIASAAYVINGAVATPTFSPIAGSYVGTQSVTVSSATSGATFYYTVDGSTPTTGSTLYSGPVSVAASETLKVLAVKSAFSNSAIASAAYVITPDVDLSPVNLLTAANYRILAKSTITNASSATVTGDMGLSPAAASFITGFSLTLDGGGQFATSSLVSGHVTAASYGGATATALTAAVSDMEAAYTNGAGRTSWDFTELGAGEIGSLTLAPGLYRWAGAVTISNDVTLSGDADDVWIFQIGSTLNLATGKQIILSGGALASNVFWIVAGAATLTTSSVFRGILLGQTSIAVQATCTVHGQLLAQTAVTLISGNVGA